MSELTGRGVRVEFVKEGLAFDGSDSAMSALLLNVMGAFAGFERSLICERQRESIEVAKKNGVHTGRQPKLNAAQVAQICERLAAESCQSRKARPTMPVALDSGEREERGGKGTGQSRHSRRLPAGVRAS